MLLWYAEILRDQCAEGCFGGFFKGTPHRDGGGSRGITIVQLHLRLHLGAHGSGFFQDICFAFPAYDSPQGANADIFSQLSCLLRLRRQIPGEEGNLRQCQICQRPEDHRPQEDAADQGKLLPEAGFGGQIQEDADHQRCADDAQDILPKPLHYPAPFKKHTVPMIFKAHMVPVTPRSKPMAAEKSSIRPESRLLHSKAQRAAVAFKIR